MTYSCLHCGASFDTVMDRNAHQNQCRGNPPSASAKKTSTGVALEELARESVALFEGHGLSIDQVSPRTAGAHGKGGIFSGRVVGKGMLDYVGDLNGRAVYFDAKSCDGTALPLSCLFPNGSHHQVERVKRGHARGAVTFFLVGFPKNEPPRFFALTWPVLAPYLLDDLSPAGRKSVPLSAFLAGCVEVHRVGKHLDLLTTIGTLAGRVA